MSNWKRTRCPFCRDLYRVVGIHKVACRANPNRTRAHGFQTAKRGWRKYPEGSTRRRCNGPCGRNLPLQDFHGDRTTALGVKSRCKDCISAARGKGRREKAA